MSDLQDAKADLQDPKADLHCPECQGVLEAGQVEFDTESGLDIWWHGDATPPRKGWRRFFGALYETITITGAWGRGRRQGYRCPSCRLIMFEYHDDTPP